MLNAATPKAKNTGLPNPADSRMVEMHQQCESMAFNPFDLNGDYTKLSMANASNLRDGLSNDMTAQKEAYSYSEEKEKEGLRFNRMMRCANLITDKTLSIPGFDASGLPALSRDNLLEDLKKGRRVSMSEEEWAKIPEDAATGPRNGKPFAPCSVQEVKDHLSARFKSLANPATPEAAPTPAPAPAPALQHATAGV